jgi:mycothiol synthase
MSIVQPLRIGPASPGERDAAVRLICHQLPKPDSRQPTDGAVTAIATVAGSREGLLGAWRGGQLVGAVLFHVQPGRIAGLWPPHIIANEPPGTAAALLDAASRELAAQNVRVVQALAETDAQPGAELLRQSGYIHAADLLYLVSPADQFPTAPPRSVLEFETYSAANHERLARIVDATYEQTLDCPHLNGVREVEDVLAGYRATGRFDPSRWLIVRHKGADIGCLLLTDHPEHGACELVYMGVVPSARGHGWGMDIARHAQWLAYEANRTRLALAVDAGNTPAVAMYAAVGFQAWDRRSAYVQILGE